MTSFTKIDHYEREYADTHHDTALNVTEGVEEQPIISPYFKRHKKRALSTDEYVEGILAGKRLFSRFLQFCLHGRQDAQSLVNGLVELFFFFRKHLENKVLLFFQFRISVFRAFDHSSA